MPKRLPDSPKYKQAQAYYRTILANERRISCLESEITRQQSRLSLNGVEGGESVSKTMEGDAFERGFVKLYDYCDALDTELVGYVEERERAMRTLERLTDGKMVEVIYMRYFEGMMFKDIARVLFISEPHVYDLHTQAMCRLWSSIPAEFRKRP